MSWIELLNRKFFFSEAQQLVKQGRLKNLENQDLCPLPSEFDPQIKRLNEHEIQTKDGRHLLFSLLSSAKKQFIFTFSLFLISTLFALSSPSLVHFFLETLSHVRKFSDINLSVIFISLSLGLVGLFRGFFIQHYFYQGIQLQQNITAWLNREIYLHSLKVTPEVRQSVPIGDIVNLMSSDTDAISDFPMMLCEILNTAIMLIGVSVFLFYYLGATALYPLCVLLVLIPMTQYVAKQFVKFDEIMMKKRDHRISLMSQILGAIRTVKYFSWEKSLEKEVLTVRDGEMAARKKMARAEIISNLSYVSVSALVLFVTLWSYSKENKNLSISLVFTCVTLFGLLAEPLGDLSRLISRLSAGFIGAQRVSSFLKQQTIQDKYISTVAEPKNATTDSFGLRISKLNFSYKTSKSLVLKGLHFQMPEKESLAIVGPVGSGKSTLLSLMLSELTPLSGEIQWLPDSIDDLKTPRLAYVPQESFIMSGSLYDNLVFGSESVTSNKISEVLDFTCLSEDLKLFPQGLRTEIGEKGVNLSGGQKQRVSLGRAALSEFDVVILDDPFSALDFETEKSIADKLIFGLWKNKTRIAVTHRLSQLHRFDKILFLTGDGNYEFGTWHELNKSVPFQKFISFHESTHQSLDIQTQIQNQEASEQVSGNSHRLTEDEEKEQGQIKKSLFWDYILSLAGDFKFLNISILFFGAVIVASMPLLQRFWLSQISEPSSWIPSLSLAKMLSVYGLIIVVSVLFEFLNHLFWLHRGIRAGQKFHDQMLKSVLNAKIRFFDSTPIGRILQRFSRDIEAVDIHLQWSFDIVIQCLLNVLVSLGLIIVVLPATVIFIVPILWLYYGLQRDYRRPAREVKRMDSIARSPRYAHFKETLMGLSVIRAFGKQKWFINEFYHRLCESQKVFFNHILLNRWFSVRIPIVGGLIASGTGLMMILFVARGHMTAGLAGVVTVYSMSFWSFLNWGIRVFADLESRMTSIERLKFYAHLPSEYLGKNPGPTGWPSEGEVRFQDVHARYADHLPYVLNGVTVEIPAKARVGLIGRTGSGKSTLFQTLYRLVDIQSGDILIDGVSIKDIQLSVLRKSLAIIPQDPQLFLGTLRDNLDRYHESTDQEILQALADVGLGEFVAGLSLGLQFSLSENGWNLSQGQRQLICLARALLRKSKIVILDEATASVDVETDVKIQKVLKEKLQNSTVLIIAHRLGTVTDCDLVIELFQGRVVQVLNQEQLQQEKKRLADILTESTHGE